MAEFVLSEVEVACHVTLPAVKLAASTGLLSKDGQKFTANGFVGPALAGASARYVFGQPAEFLGMDMLGLPVYGKAAVATDCGAHNSDEVHGTTTHCEICGVQVWS